MEKKKDSHDASVRSVWGSKLEFCGTTLSGEASSRSHSSVEHIPPLSQRNRKQISEAEDTEQVN